MPVYVYETTDDAEPKQFEVRQSMKDPAFTQDPETGRPVRRVISGGFGFVQKAAGTNNVATGTPGSGGGHGCGGGGCGCH